MKPLVGMQTPSVSKQASHLAWAKATKFCSGEAGIARFRTLLLEPCPQNPCVASRFDEASKQLILRRAGGKEVSLHPAYVRRNDTSATSIDEWTGEKLPAGGSVADGIVPTGIQAVGNYAVLIMWEDGFNQVPPPPPQALLEPPPFSPPDFILYHPS